MKSKVLAIVLGMILAMSVTVSVGAANAENVNLLQNPGFEDGLTGWTVKRQIDNTDWDKLSDLTSASGGVFTYGDAGALTEPADLGDGFDANYLEITKSSARSLILTKVTGLRAGGTYLFSGWANCTSADAASTGNVCIIYSYYSGDALLNTLTRDASAYGSDGTVAITTKENSWVSFQTTFALPIGADGVEIGIKTDYRDTAARRYDNFSLTEQKNMILNGGFEDVTFSNDKGTAADWYLSPNNVTKSFSADSHSGSSAFWVGDGQNDTYIQQFAPVTGSLQYKLSFWMKVESTSTKALKAKAILYFYDTAPASSTEYTGTSVGTIEVRGTLQTPTDGWRETVVYFTVPASAKGMGVRFYSCGLSSGESPNKGLVMFDDVVLTMASENVELLGISNSKPTTGTHYSPNATYTENVTTWVDDLQKTLSPVESIEKGSTYYVAAMTQNAASSIVMLALYEKTENDTQQLKAVKVLSGTETVGIISTTEGITVPDDTGEYTLKAYAWDTAGGIKPVAEQIVIQ